MTPASFHRLLSELSAGNFTEASNTIVQLQREGDLRSALIGRLVLATRQHDSQQLQAIAASSEASPLREDAKLHAMLARALYWTVGIQTAADELRAVCAREDFDADDQSRSEACALSELARLVRHIPLWQITGATQSSVELLADQALPIILASVNGLSPEYFILDTGAPTSLLSRSYCDRVGIPYVTTHPKVAYDGGGNEVTLYPALVDRVDVGGLAIGNWTAHVAQLSPNLRVGGIISPLDTFRGMPTELDLRTRRLSLHPSVSEDDWAEGVGERIYSAPLIWDDGNVLVKATVNGTAPGWFLFDTGAPANFVSRDMARSLGKAVSPESGLNSTTAAGTTPVLRGFEGTLTTGDSAAVTTQFMIKERFSDDEAIAPLTVSGYVGLPWMAGRRLLFAADGCRILFTEPESVS